MRLQIAILLLVLTPLIAATANETGLVSRDSPYKVAETVERIESALGAKGVKVFARINHSGEAAGAGLSLRPTELLIFGNAKAGTALMQAAPTMGIDLPLKVLVWQDDQGQVHVTWNSPDYLTQRHGLDADSGKPLAAIGALIEAAVK
jgi:uncharacterized protein (DUF302 family)